MTKAASDQDFWTSLCMDVQAAGGELVFDSPKKTTELVAGAFVIRLDVPGFKSGDITVSWEDHSVRIVGQVPSSHGGFSGLGAPRDFVVHCPVPSGFDLSGLTALLSQGMLSVTVPPKPKPAVLHPVDPINDQR